MRTDDELMLLAASGLRPAFAMLAQRYMARLTQFCVKMTGDAAAAEEIAQQAWLEIWRHRARYVPRGKFIVLLYAAARNRCRNRARDTQRQAQWIVRESDAVLETTGAAPEQLDSLLERERERQVHEALANLPEKLREAVILRYSEGFSYEDIATALEINASTARSRVFHGLRALRSYLDGGRR
jgi:RNA polymerase sigma-70 factor (ECF subfamily)